VTRPLRGHFEGQFETPASAPEGDEGWLVTMPSVAFFWSRDISPFPLNINEHAAIVVSMEAAIEITANNERTLNIRDQLSA
jgi:hypothetical protein